ncbi:hypothetical protein M3J09_005569 [Ascochyta lentis]
MLCSHRRGKEGSAGVECGGR